MKRFISLTVILVTALLAEDKLTIFGHAWTVPNAQDWKVSEDNGQPMLQLLVGREPLPGPRRPNQFAVLDAPPISNLTLEADVRPTKRSLIIVFAYQDPAHFNYVHFSSDTAAKQPVHNGVFHVFGGERVRISSTEGPPAFNAINKWFHLKFQWNGTTGEVQGFIDGTPIPALHAVDLSLKQGKIGLGSFDETADFKSLQLNSSEPRP